MKPVFGSLLVVLALGCATQPATPPARETTSRLLSPLKVSWAEVSRTDREAVVRATVERVLAIDMPFALEVELPAGVKVVEGRTRLTLLPNSEAVTVTEQLTLQYDAPPAGDAVLKVDGESGTMGFHYRVPYRFGRPEPVEAPPAATGPGFKKGDQQFGPSVPLK